MQALKRWVKQQLLNRNMIISKPPGQFAITKPKLRKLKERGLTSTMAIDGGAASGGWAVEFKEIFPSAQILCIEPRDDAQAELAAFAKATPGIHIAKTLVGESIGTVDFYSSKEQSSMLPNAARGAFGTLVRENVDTLDHLIASRGLPAPDYIKLDLQGAELLALRGGSEVLKTAQVVELEVSLIAFQKGNPLVAEVIQFMAERDFRLADIYGLWTRPLDGALAQGDFVFMRNNHPLLQDSRWSSDGPG